MGEEGGGGIVFGAGKEDVRWDSSSLDLHPKGVDDRALTSYTDAPPTVPEDSQNRKRWTTPEVDRKDRSVHTFPC